MKYLLIIFTIGLFVINHNKTIQTILSGDDDSNLEIEIIIKRPVIKTSIDSLHTEYTTIANNYDLPEVMNIHFIVNEKGSIHNPEFKEVDNPYATLKLIYLVRSIEADPGLVSGKTKSMGMGLKLVSK